MTTLQVLSVLFATAAIFGLISTRWLRLPLTVGTMLLTVLLSIALGAIGKLAPGMHAWAFTFAAQIDFGSIILHGMLPLLLFAGAFLLDVEQLAREKMAVSILAFFGTIFSTFAVASLMFLFVGARFPWMQCLIFGALISPTDPIAVLEMLRRVGVSKTVQAQLAGESLFNDGVGAVLFIGALNLATGNGSSPIYIAGSMVAKPVGAILLAILMAWVVSQLMRRVDAYQVDILFTVALALGGYVLADLLHLSAPIEAVVAGIALRFFNRGQPAHRVAHQHISEFWAAIDEIQNSVLFVLLGMEVLVIQMDWTALHDGFAAIFAVNVVRLAAVAGLLGIIWLFRRNQQGSILILTWGGLRGGLSIALALSVPPALGRSWMLGATYLVVVFSILLQGSSMKWLLHHLHAHKQAA
ncbi:MAG: sodium:proton antiporter [Terracidiphilus sp.]